MAIENYDIPQNGNEEDYYAYIAMKKEYEALEELKEAYENGEISEEDYAAFAGIQSGTQSTSTNIYQDDLPF